MYHGIIAQQHVDALAPFLSSDGNMGRVMAEQALREDSTRPAVLKLVQGGKLTPEDKSSLPYAVTGQRLDRVFPGKGDSE